jgi:hypothetical protein
MVGILVDVISERLKYTLDFVFAERGVEYNITKSVHDFENGSFSFRLNYSSRSVEGVKQIVPATLLSETNVLNQVPEKGIFEKIECLSFNEIVDPIASIFYVLTRYEEYSVSRKDEHGRFSAEFSIQKKYGWLQQAVCDRWSKAILEFVHPDLFMDTQLQISMGGGPKIIPSFDIDNTYAYKYKTGKRKLLSILRDCARLDLSRLSERKAVLNGSVKDPYDTFERIKEIAVQFPLTRIFWLVRSIGQKDRNLSINCAEHMELINEMAASSSLGLHPSYGSFGNADRIEGERNDLQEIIGSSVNSTRFHYLRFRLPKSYRNLIRAGITDDYSMGYASETGFRAGTARSFRWFDLEKNERTALKIHPFVYMDGTLHEYLHLSLSEAQKRVSELYDEVKSFGGDFIFIWHNETIGDYKKWEGWSSILDHTLNLNQK